MPKRQRDSTEGIFLGMGNPLLDISAEVDQAFLDKYGVKLNDAILCEDKHKPVYEELVSKCKASYIAGGATQNTVRVAQWMLPSNSTGYVGCVGKDAFGKQLRECANGDGVATHYLEDAETPTGTCAVLVKDGERSLIANLAAANNYKNDHFQTPAIQAVVDKAQFIYSAGFFLTVSPPTVQEVGKHCADNNKVFCMNLSAPFIVQFFDKPLADAIPFVDYMFGNESEAAAFGEKNGLKDQSVEAVALHISQMAKTNSKRKRVVVITQGADPTVVATDGKVVKYDTPKLSKDQIVDSNGAGDSFMGGFMAALIQGKKMQECVDQGNYAAGVILGVSGCDVSKQAPDAKFMPRDVKKAKSV
jgi:adenosine kinase